MLRKLYDMGCFDYQSFIIMNQKSLSLSAEEVIVLIKILDNYKNSKAIEHDKIYKSVNMTKAKLDKALASLNERKFYEFYIEENNGKVEELVSIDGFFNKATLILDNKEEDTKDELYKIIQLVQSGLNRTLTSKEIEIVQCLVIEDRYKYDNFSRAIDKIKGENRLLTIKTISNELSIKEEVKKSNKKSVGLDFFNRIK